MTQPMFSTPGASVNSTNRFLKIKKIIERLQNTHPEMAIINARDKNKKKFLTFRSPIQLAMNPQ